MQSYRFFALALVLAVAPVMVKTETSVEEQESAQPKSFSQKCYAYRYHIGASVVLAAAVIAYACYCKSKMVKFQLDTSKLTDEQAVNLAEEMTKGMELPKKDAIVSVSNASTATTASTEVMPAAPSQNEQPAQAPQEATLPDQNAGTNMGATLVKWKDSIFAWVAAKTTEIAADWQKVETPSWEKTLHYAKPLPSENK